MRQSRWAALLAVMAISTIVAVAAATSGGAAEPEDSNRFTVNKVVVGTVPNGTEFNVRVTCGNSVHIVVFDTNGNPDPSGSNVFQPGSETTCTAVETGTSGASSVSYACAIEFGSTDDEHTLASCTADNVAHFGDVIHDSATVTVTNTFEAVTTTTTTTTTTLPPPASSPAVVQVPPKFTG